MNDYLRYTRPGPPGVRLVMRMREFLCPICGANVRTQAPNKKRCDKCQAKKRAADYAPGGKLHWRKYGKKAMVAS